MEMAVLGAESHGRDLAQVLAGVGHEVRLQDADATLVMNAVDDVERRMENDDPDNTLGRIDATTDLEAAVRNAKMAIISNTMDAEAARQRLATIEEAVDRQAILAITVRDTSVTNAAAGLRHPDRAIGVGLPDPLSATVIELVVADQTSQQTVERMEAIVSGLDANAAVVRDHPGFVDARLALATEVEAMRVLEDGVASVSDVDAAFGRRHEHPMGPLERADRAGLANRLEDLKSLSDTLGDRFAPPDILKDLVARGQTGLESGTGFYEWKNDDAASSALPEPDIVNRTAGPDDPSHE